MPVLRLAQPLRLPLLGVCERERFLSVAHGAESLHDTIGQFLAYFVPRKMMTPGPAAMGDITSALRALVEHCAEKAYFPDGYDTESLLETIQVSAEFQAEKIQEEVQRLGAAGWGDRLPATGRAAERVETGMWMDGWDEMPEVVSLIRDDGWEFESGEFLKLPLALASMGLEGMTLSCFQLEAGGNGYWEPGV